MELIGISVEHKKFGTGVVKELSEGRISIDFNGKIIKLQYPDAFEEFLTATDPDIQREVLLEIEAIKIKKQKEKEEKWTKIEEVINTKPVPESGSRASSKKKYNDNTLNYAFKCNYCDGGANSEYVGFNGACSAENIKYHIEKGSDNKWCNYEDCLCKQYYKGIITREELEKGDFCCYESTIMKKACFRAGGDTVNNMPKPRHMPGILPGGLCVLTTQFPGNKERYIFGAYIADSVYEGDNEAEGYAECNSDLHLMFSPDETRKFKFWDYYSNPNKPESKQWGTGLYRKLNTKQALEVLEHIVEMKKGTANEDIAVRMLKAFKEKNRLENDN